MVVFKIAPFGNNISSIIPFPFLEVSLIDPSRDLDFISKSVFSFSSSVKI